MPSKKTRHGAKAPCKTKTSRSKSNPAKPHGKASALDEAVKAATRAVGSSRRSRSRSTSPDDQPNPRFVYKDHSPVGSIDAELNALVSYSGDEADLGDAPSSPMGIERREDDGSKPAAAVGADAQAKAAADGAGDVVVEEASPPKNLTLLEGQESARVILDERATTKKRAASQSPLQQVTKAEKQRPLFESSSNSEEEDGHVHVPEVVVDARDEQQERLAAARLRGALCAESPYLKGYFPPDENTGSPLFLEQLVAPRGLIGGRTSKGAFERALVKVHPLFHNNLEAARCVLLAPHRAPLKEFTSFRKKAENKGGLVPVWGYPWVQPVNTSTSAQAEDLFWKWHFVRGFAPKEIDHLRGEQSMSAILDQRDFRIEFAHLISKRHLTSQLEELRRKAMISAHDERGYSVAAAVAIPPHSAKKVRCDGGHTHLSFRGSVKALTTTDA